MQKIKKIFLPVAVFSFFSLSACQERVSLWEPQKYNRNSNQFGKAVTNRNKVVFCSKSAGKTTKEHAINEAKRECAKFGKKAQYQNYSIATCPLSKPVSWHFICVAP